MTDAVKKCSQCDYCVIEDFGYSNYTVEGSNVYCARNLNLDAPFDRWYGGDKRDLIASACPSFQDTVGPVEIDVDMEDGNYGAYSNGVLSATDINGTLT